jgi:4-hydroxythreonine-4-phosphate dehydrogenase
MTDKRLPTITISMGDPAGIGPEVCLKALADRDIRDMARWILVGEGWIIDELSAQIGYHPEKVVDDVSHITADDSVVVVDLQQLKRSERIIGRISAACGRAGLEYVRKAVQLCLSGQAQALVTAPLNKEAVAFSGVRFVGHTEFVAELCGVRESRMLLVNDRLCVVHVSTHCSLRSAARLSVERIVKTIELGCDAVTRLRRKRPRIAVCGLNPHAGEGGMFGEEESKYIVPAIIAACLRGVPCEGPLPADTLFMQAARGKYDLVVAMYHDQGHIPMKLLDFEHTVNVTLGLPIVRTSVDHGTAFDIAGQNKACADDMKSAMRLAVQMAERCSALRT